MRILLERGAGANISGALDMGLLFACGRGNHQCAEVLLYAGASANAANKVGRQP